MSVTNANLDTDVTDLLTKSKEETSDMLYDLIQNSNNEGFIKLIGKLATAAIIFDLDGIINKTIPGGRKTPLIVVAATLNNYVIIETLIKHNADVNRFNKYNQTALYFACLNGNTAMVSLLMKNGANPNIIDKEYGNTTLYVAAFHGNLTIMKALLKLWS